MVVEPELSVEERERLQGLGTDLASVWKDPEASGELKKRIARLLVKEVVVFVSESAFARWCIGKAERTRRRRWRGFLCVTRVNRRRWIRWRSYAVWPVNSPTDSSPGC